MREIVLVIFTGLLIGCAAEVKPWQKETLTKSQMQPSSGHILLENAKTQIFISKEGSRGGSGAGGGGCGCK